MRRHVRLFRVVTPNSRHFSLPKHLLNMMNAFVSKPVHLLRLFSHLWKRWLPLWCPLLSSQVRTALRVSCLPLPPSSRIAPLVPSPHIHHLLLNARPLIQALFHPNRVRGWRLSSSTKWNSKLGLIGKLCVKSYPRFSKRLPTTAGIKAALRHLRNSWIARLLALQLQHRVWISKTTHQVHSEELNILYHVQSSQMWASMGPFAPALHYCLGLLLHPVVLLQWTPPGYVPLVAFMGRSFLPNIKSVARCPLGVPTGT